MEILLRSAEGGAARPDAVVEFKVERGFFFRGGSKTKYDK